jgi:tRNA(Ile)-lysidine synthase
MSSARAAPSRRDPTIRTILRRWRALTGGPAARDEQRRTLVACSGGADSSALLLALASVSPPPYAAHVVHDIRPPEQAERDRRAVARLCERLAVPFHHARVEAAALPGNTESNARRARYDALAEIARDAACPYVATAHHADDQLETLLMRLARGSGLRGLTGIHPSRPLDHAVTLVRPMLDVRRDHARELCRRHAVEWTEDETNADLSRFRAAIRERVLPPLLDIAPDAPLASVRLAETLASVQTMLRDEARRHEEHARHADGVTRFSRDHLRRLPRATLAELILYIYHLKTGGFRQDRVGSREIDTCIGVITDETGGVRTYLLGAMNVLISNDEVHFS